MLFKISDRSLCQVLVLTTLAPAVSAAPAAVVRPASSLATLPAIDPRTPRVLAAFGSCLGSPPSEAPIDR